MAKQTKTKKTRGKRRGLEHVGYATITGSRRLGSPGRGCGRSGKRWRVRFVALRAWLVGAVGEEDYLLAQRFFVAGVSCRQEGDASARDPGTVCRDRQRLRVRLREAILIAACRPLARRGSVWRWVQKQVTALAASALADGAVAALAAPVTACILSPQTARPVPDGDFKVTLLAVRAEQHPSLTFEGVRSYILRHGRRLFRPGRVCLGVRVEAGTGHVRLDLVRVSPNSAPAIQKPTGRRSAGPWGVGPDLDPPRTQIRIPDRVRSG